MKRQISFTLFKQSTIINLDLRDNNCLLIAFALCLPSFVASSSIQAKEAKPAASYVAERWGESIKGGIAAKPVIGEESTRFIKKRRQPDMCK
ncbi:hypothetical protein [Bacillus sp. FJAT-28004]|uniref:hypothetical protein n=1 Tax=Bacillus sp. FJAT-28004 TaxID=1679165 RepID=UPI0006B5424B|nr:hypothetical protein [Bacillus sp. FJAT-28004]